MEELCIQYSVYCLLFSTRFISLALYYKLCFLFCFYVSVSKTSKPQDTPVTSRTEHHRVENGVVPPDGDTYKHGVNLLPEETGKNALTPDIIPQRRNIPVLTVKDDISCSSQTPERQMYQPIDLMNKQITAENQILHSNIHMPNPCDHNETPVRAGPSSKYVGPREPNVCYTKLPLTPEEPQLSEYTMQLFSVLRSAENNQSNIYSISNEGVPHTGERETTVIPAKLTGQQLTYSERKTYTPEEPTLYTHLSSSQTEDQSPCEPVLLSCEVGYHKDNFRDNNTPEEPSLSCEVGLNKKSFKNNRTPEEPALSHKAGLLKKSQKDNNTPEEPVLSYGAGHNIGNFRAKRTLEEPELITTERSRPLENIASKVVTTSLERENGIPCSPELSGIAQSVLSLSTRNHQLNHRGSNTATFHNKPRHHKVGPSFSDMYNLLSATPSSDEHHFREVLRPLNNNNLRANYKSETEESTLTASAGSSTTMENFLGIDALPPSPQISDVTQNYFKLLRR